MFSGFQKAFVQIKKKYNQFNTNLNNNNSKTNPLNFLQNQYQQPFSQNLIFEGNKQNAMSLWLQGLKGKDWLESQKQMHQSKFMNIDVNEMKNILEQQIIFLEPSPVQQKLKELNGRPFRDDRFPPNQNSLTGQWGYVSEWKDINWQPISKAIPKAKIFEGKIQPNDIKQGYLGDCYFLAALAALAQRPHRIMNLFLTTEKNNQNYFSVKMLFKGKWMRIDMDEYIPFLYNEPAFTKSKGGQLWVVLLEKAWAKMYTSYKRIQAGYPEQGLHDLTGAPIKQIYMQNSSFNKQQEWNYLIQASKRQYSMVCSSQPGSDSTQSFSGIVQGHAYTFLNATYLNFQGRQQRIVQLRNPWGKGQSKGRWSDYDQNWKYVDANQKRRIGFRDDKDDGVFFMTYDDFCREFRALTVAQVNDNASYVYKSCKDPQNNGCYFKVTIYKHSEYSFQVDKTPERSYEDSRQNSFRYPSAQIKIAPTMKKYSSMNYPATFSSRRTSFHKQKLQAGQYVVFVKINYDCSFERDFAVNLAIYAEYACEISLASKNQACAFEGHSNVHWTGQQTEARQEWNNLQSYHGGGNFNPGIHNQNNIQGYSNDGWGDYFEKKRDPQQNNDGWGDYFNKKSQPYNSGWGNNGGGNNGGGNNGGGNSGWGNNGGGNNGGGNNNKNQYQKNDGWGDYFQNKPKGPGNLEQNDGWGDYFSQGQNQKKYGSNQQNYGPSSGW